MAKHKHAKRQNSSHHAPVHGAHHAMHAHAHTIARKEFIISQPSSFDEKKSFVATQIMDHDKGLLYYSTAKFYALPGQMDLVLHGVPFHLIKNQFMRFHAVQATILGWEFSVAYMLIFFFSVINAVFFAAAYLDVLLWLFLTAVLLHSLMSMFYAYRASKGHETHLPLMGKVARRIAED